MGYNLRSESALSDSAVGSGFRPTLSSTVATSESPVCDPTLSTRKETVVEEAAADLLPLPAGTSVSFVINLGIVAGHVPSGIAVVSGRDRGQGGHRSLGGH